MPPSGLPALTGAVVSPAPFVVPSVPVATAAAAQPGRIEDRLIAAAPQAMPFTNWRLLIFPSGLPSSISVFSHSFIRLSSSNFIL